MFGKDIIVIGAPATIMVWRAAYRPSAEKHNESSGLSVLLPLMLLAEVGWQKLKSMTYLTPSALVWQTD
jgi:hypothetical protein